MVNPATIEEIKSLAAKKKALSPTEAQRLVRKVKELFDDMMATAGFPGRAVRRISTKFRDAGRRSAPWKPASSKVPGRPQDGSDGNRINRWLMAPDHKFYADEVTACLVEVKYYLQALSMNDAPALPDDTLKDAFIWLVGHIIEPGAFRDPIQLLPVSIGDVLADARLIQSGHIHPLDRDGRHESSNATLMLARSNQIQGNQTVEELFQLMRVILEKHDALITKAN
jgi:hypothetical protein